MSHDVHIPGTLSDFEPDSIGPPIGAPFPPVTLPDQRGEVVDLHASRRGRRAVVVFVRSAVWCPYCQAQLRELQRARPALIESDTTLFTISYDQVDELATFADRHAIAFSMLSDPTSETIARLRMLDERLAERYADLGKTPRPEQHGVAFPGIFLVDEGGVVVDRIVHGSHRERESAPSLLQKLAIAAPTERPAAATSTRDDVLQVQGHLLGETLEPYQWHPVEVELIVSDGWHLYVEPTPQGYVGLDLQPEAGDDLLVRGLEIPDGRPHQVNGLDETFHVINGRTTIRASVLSKQRPGSEPRKSVRLTVNYQACSDTTCLRPTRVRIDLPSTGPTR